MQRVMLKIHPVSTMISNNNTCSRQRRRIRGPERFRWTQRKQDPPLCPPQCSVSVGAFLLVVLSTFVILMTRMTTLSTTVEGWNATSTTEEVGTELATGFHDQYDGAAVILKKKKNLLLYNDDDKDMIRGNTMTTNQKKLRGTNASVAKRQRHYRDTFNADSDIDMDADAIVIGSGLAGLTATLTILDRGGRVVLIEKESMLGGNSNKASSGMNSCCSSDASSTTNNNNDTIEEFIKDTVQSAGDVADLELINTLVEGSSRALQWFQNRVNIDLSVIAQLGGHSHPRTYRPPMGFVGAELINAMEIAIQKFVDSNQVRILTDTQVTQILYDTSNNSYGRQQTEKTIVGVEARTKHIAKLGSTGGPKDSILTPIRLRSDHVILATGGFASDRSAGSYLEKYRPELMGMAATAGEFSTGDGITLAEQLGAATRDMSKIQIHPTGFVDPADPLNPNKVLAAELLRGVGGVLLNKSGQRFCNELGTRAYVTDKMLEHNPTYAESRKWDINTPIPSFSILLSSASAKGAQKHVDIYLRKGLLSEVKGVTNLGKHLGLASKSLRKTLQDYYGSDALLKGSGDRFGKTVFHGIQSDGTDLYDEDAFWYVGEVTPVLHYCMGGLKIDKHGKVLSNDDSQPIRGLHAAGEVTGGVHGNNRLGGNSLLECAVYGSIVGNQVPIPFPATTQQLSKRQGRKQDKKSNKLKLVSFAELSMHSSSADDIWVAIYGKVYDLTNFLHPGGEHSILPLAGTDGTNIFSTIHSETVLSRLDEYQIGMLDATSKNDRVHPLSLSQEKYAARPITIEELNRHNTAQDCWISFFGTVYDLTEFSKTHPGGAFIVQKHAGKDASSTFGVFHPRMKLDSMQYAIVGTLLGDNSEATTVES